MRGQQRKSGSQPGKRKQSSRTTRRDTSGRFTTSTRGHSSGRRGTQASSTRQRHGDGGRRSSGTQRGGERGQVFGYVREPHYGEGRERSEPYGWRGFSGDERGLNERDDLRRYRRDDVRDRAWSEGRGYGVRSWAGDDLHSYDELGYGEGRGRELDDEGRFNARGAYDRDYGRRDERDDRYWRSARDERDERYGRPVRDERDDRYGRSTRDERDERYGRRAERYERYDR